MSTAPPQVPLVVGVTGHRDLVEAEVPRLEAAVEQFLGDMRRSFPALPLLVMTPLAEGADQLVARVARRLDLPVVILLPMPLGLYRADFDGVAADTFQEMLTEGEIIELPLLGGASEDTGMLSSDARDAQYEYVGIYLAAHCHILLALWDGRPSPAPGGTAHVIRFHQYNEVAMIPGEARSPIDFSEDESDLAYHIVCSRANNGPPEAGLEPGESAWLTRDELESRAPTLPERYRRVFLQQEQLNRDLAAAGGARAAGEAEPRSPEAPPSSVIDDLAAAVDGLAVTFQRRAIRALRAIYIMAGLTGLSFIAYADFASDQSVIWVYLGLLALLFVLYTVERRGAWYRRYVDYRGLAQGLLIQAYWTKAGVRMVSPTEFAHDRYMRREELSLGWIRNIMRYASHHTDALAEEPTAGSLETVIDDWVEDQHDYYRQRLGTLLKRTRTLERLSVVGIAFGVGAALTLALFQERLGAVTVNALIAAMGGLPLLVAVRSGYADRVCERALIAQYAHMDRIYANARRLLRTTRDVTARRSILRALGEEALQEIGEWVLRQRESPVAGDELFRGG